MDDMIIIGELISRERFQEARTYMNQIVLCYDSVRGSGTARRIAKIEGMLLMLDFCHPDPERGERE